jgi:uncharacterized protein (DUF58 family)
MNKIFLLLLVFVLFSASANAQTLKFSMIGQDPDPVQAGDVVEIRFKAENIYQETKEGVAVEIAPSWGTYVPQEVVSPQKKPMSTSGLTTLKMSNSNCCSKKARRCGLFNFIC